jgi:hypothetical protein
MWKDWPQDRNGALKRLIAEHFLYNQEMSLVFNKPRPYSASFVCRADPLTRDFLVLGRH